MEGDSLATVNLYKTFLVYAIVFKLAVIATGIVAMLLGYWLINASARNVENSEKEGVSVKLKAGAASLFIRNTTSGVVFALFGMIIISVMVWRGSPQLEHTSAKDPNASTTVVRGGDAKETEPSLADMIREGTALLQDGDAQAVGKYQEALSLLSRAANVRAYHYQQENRLSNAQALAELAVTLDPNDADAQDTLAQVLIALGRDSEALTHAEAAAQLDPGRYQEACNQLRRRLEQQP